MLHALSFSVMTDSPSPTAVCDVCQSRQALVTLGVVDYCAICAPALDGAGVAVGRALHPSSLPALELTADDEHGFLVEAS